MQTHQRLRASSCCERLSGITQRQGRTSGLQGRACCMLGQGRHCLTNDSVRAFLPSKIPSPPKVPETLNSLMRRGAIRTSCRTLIPLV